MKTHRVRPYEKYGKFSLSLFILHRAAEILSIPDLE